MNQADIKQVIEKQGLAFYLNVRRDAGNGNGKEKTYYYVYAIEGHGKQRIRHALGALPVVSQMSEADLVTLIKTKITEEEL